MKNQGNKAVVSSAADRQLAMTPIEFTAPEPVKVVAEIALETAREIQETMSRTDLLLACPYPWGKRGPYDKPGLPARFGSAFHEVMAALLDRTRIPEGGFAAIKSGIPVRYGSDVDADDVLARAESSFEYLSKWLAGENQFGVDFGARRAVIEVSVAYNPIYDEARYCAPPRPEDHIYPDKQPDEICGTEDLIAPSPTAKRGKLKNTILVLDHKTGWEVGQPAESGQLLTLALAFSRIYKSQSAVVAFNHAPSTDTPTVYADTIGPQALQKHRTRLIEAMRLRGTGIMRIGPHCEYCPAYSICPTNRTSLVELRRGSLAEPLTAERVGYIHEALGQYDKLATQLRSELREWVKQNGPGVRSDGKIVDILTKNVRNLSMASIERALGKIEGAKEIARLEKLGCIETSEREELRAVAEKGK